MNVFTLLFLAVLFIGLGVECFLAYRHVIHIRTHRDQVPRDFSDRISLEAHRKAADYTRAKVGFNVCNEVVGVVLVLVWTLGGMLEWLDTVVRGMGFAGLSAGVLFLFIVMLVMRLLELPMDFWRAFVLEKRFGFNRMTPVLWLMDCLKSGLLMLAIGLPGIALALWLMANSGGLWWVWVWCVWTGFSVLMMWAYPRFIAPLFNTFRPLENTALEQRIGALLNRNGFNSQGIYVMDGSVRSTHGNAYFTGFGASKRIVFFDTLMDSLKDEEIEAVLAHELGHFKCGHIPRRMLTIGLLSFFALAALGGLSQAQWFYQGLGVSRPSDYQALALFLLVSPAFIAFLQPVFAAISRRHEFEADDFASSQTHASHLISALVNLYRDNANTLTPDPLYSAFHDSHPPAVLRIANLRAKLAG